ncbi:hypothetical protein CLAIMM_07757, partial [Cladophialophora immunda]
MRPTSLVISVTCILLSHVGHVLGSPEPWWKGSGCEPESKQSPAPVSTTAIYELSSSTGIQRVTWHSPSISGSASFQSTWTSHSPSTFTTRVSTTSSRIGTSGTTSSQVTSPTTTSTASSTTPLSSSTFSPSSTTTSTSPTTSGTTTTTTTSPTTTSTTTSTTTTTTT